MLRALASILKIIMIIGSNLKTQIKFYTMIINTVLLLTSGEIICNLHSIWLMPPVVSLNDTHSYKSTNTAWEWQFVQIHAIMHQSLLVQIINDVSNWSWHPPPVTSDDPQEGLSQFLVGKGITKGVQEAVEVAQPVRNVVQDLRNTRHFGLGAEAHDERQQVPGHPTEDECSQDDGDCPQCLPCTVFVLLLTPQSLALNLALILLPSNQVPEGGGGDAVKLLARVFWLPPLISSTFQHLKACKHVFIWRLSQLNIWDFSSP